MRKARRIELDNAATVSDIIGQYKIFRNDRMSVLTTCGEKTRLLWKGQRQYIPKEICNMRAKEIAAIKTYAECKIQIVV